MLKVVIVTTYRIVKLFILLGLVMMLYAHDMDHPSLLIKLFDSLL